MLAAKVRELGVDVLNRVFAADYLLNGGRIVGALGFGVRDGAAYLIKAKAVICCTGGASGIYRPNNPGQAGHKMWYPPFNAGAGYAMGIRAGAEFTGLEMRFIALRTKDIICPTGTLALGFGANKLTRGEEFMNYAIVLGGKGPTCVRSMGQPKKRRKAGARASSIPVI